MPLSRKLIRWRTLQNPVPVHKNGRRWAPFAPSVKPPTNGCGSWETTPQGSPGDVLASFWFSFQTIPKGDHYLEKHPLCGCVLGNTLSVHGKQTYHIMGSKHRTTKRRLPIKQNSLEPAEASARLRPCRLYHGRTRLDSLGLCFCWSH